MAENQTPHTIEIADQQNAEFDADPLIAAIQMIADDHEIGRVEISVAIVDDPTIRQLNQQYLQHDYDCLLYTSPSPRDKRQSRMPSSA